MRDISETLQCKRIFVTDAYVWSLITCLEALKQFNYRILCMNGIVIWVPFYVYKIGSNIIIKC